MTKYNTIALIVAAGSSERFKDDVPKQYQLLGGTPILRHTALKFLNHPQIDAVRIIYNREHQVFYDKAVGDLQLLPPVSGGKTRQASVFAGLQSIAGYGAKKVLIHDAARPLVETQGITDIIGALDNTNAVIPVIPVTDTIKKCLGNKVLETPTRDSLFCAQTPQGFDYAEILKAYNLIATDGATSENFTDDASIFEYFHKEVYIINGSQRNLKITTSEDLKIAETLL